MFLLSVAIYLQFGCQICRAGDHFCAAGYTLEVDLTARSHQDERLVPMMAAESSAGPLQCRWLLKAPGLTEPRHLVLQGLPLKGPAASSDYPGAEGFVDQVCQKGNVKLEFSTELRTCRKNHDISPAESVYLEAGTFRVLPVTSNRAHIHVSFSNTEKDSKQCKQQQQQLVIVRALTPLPSFCSRDMLSFHGSCYALSPMHQTATAALASIGGAAQLANFDSLAEISQLAAANAARERQYPNRRPLNLSQPIRIGLFLRQADAAVLKVARNLSSCGLQLVAPAGDFASGPSTGSCGSLTVKDETAGQSVSVEFRDCNSQMLSLLSFPQEAAVADAATAGPDCLECNWQPLLADLVRGGAFKQTEQLNAAPLIAAGSLALVIALLVAIVCAIRWRQRRQGDHRATAEGGAIDFLQGIPLKG